MQIDRENPVLVTGGSGYVAGWIVRRLLEEGATVHATVRDRQRKCGHLWALAEGSPGTLRLFEADLLKNGSYAEAMAGCAVVFHTASPFTLAVDDPDRDLIRPAVEGTRNVLETVDATESVRRVVLTSSCAAIYGDNADMADSKTGVFTEDDWNESSTPGHQAYSFSKTMAEKTAWEITKAQNRWDLVTINPSLVLGPALSDAVVSSESFTLVKQFGDGTLRMGVPSLPIGMVDVRDVAEAHVAAGFTPEAEGRHIVSGFDADFSDIGPVLREAFGGRYPFPKMITPKWMAWAVGPMINDRMTRKMISRNIGLPWRCDNSKSREKLGITYRPWQPGVVEMFQQLIDRKAL